MKTFGYLFARGVSLVIILIGSCGCSGRPDERSVGTRHGIDGQRFEILEDKIAEAVLPCELYGVLDKLTSEEISRVVVTNFPDQAASEFRIQNELRGSRVYRFILRSGDKITQGEFIDISSGGEESNVVLKNVVVFKDDSPPMGAVIR